MTWSKSALPLGLTNWVRTASSADRGRGEQTGVDALLLLHRLGPRLSGGDPGRLGGGVDRPGTGRGLVLARRRRRRRRCRRPWRCGWPSSVLIGTAARDTSSLVLDSTLTYHCCAVWTATWSATNWFLSPNWSQVSLKDLTLANPPCASITCFIQVSALTLFGSSRVGRPVSSLVPPPKTSNHMYAEPGQVGVEADHRRVAALLLLQLLGDRDDLVRLGGVQLVQRDAGLLQHPLVHHQREGLEELRHGVHLAVVGDIADRRRVVLLVRRDAVDRVALVHRDDQVLVGQGRDHAAVHLQQVGHVAGGRLGGELLRVEAGGVQLDGRRRPAAAWRSPRGTCPPRRRG